MSTSSGPITARRAALQRLRRPSAGASDDGATRRPCTCCGVSFRPGLTRGACPVCSTPAEGFDAPVDLDEDTRVMAIVMVGMVLNLLVFGWISLMLLS